MSNWAIRIEPEGKVIHAEPGESLLSALRRGAPGVLVVGCRGGGCGICKIKVVSGEVTLGVCSVSELPHEERAEGMVLACKAIPQSDLVVERVPRPGRKPA